MSLKLRDLIRQVRTCKTAQEERDVITKECANCRTEFRKTDNKFRHRNVAKMLYIHMLGYPTHFAQMEPVKLCASLVYSEKRLGYLALMVLLDEKTNVLMLVTNGLKNDLLNQNAYIAGLALCSLGNISSADMSRDLSGEVEKFFVSQNAYLRKKATLCAVRIIRKVPDLIEDFIQPTLALLNDKNHAVLLTAFTLMIEMTKLQPSVIKKFRKITSQLVRLLKQLITAGFVAEYDISGITDPFLQSRIIHLLRILGTDSPETSDSMNDILAQVAINTESAKNPGNAILYECVQAIMKIEAEPGLRVLAINILGRFLLNRDNNIRYVALKTLCSVVNQDNQAIQRHRNTIVDCLKDNDISIRKRALDLIYALVTKNNAKALVKELLNYLALTSGDRDFKADLTDKICVVAERFAPNQQWHIDTLVTVSKTAGAYTRDNVATDLIQLISSSDDLQAYSVYRLYDALTQAKNPEVPLLTAAVWVIGEYGDLLTTDEGASQAQQHAIGDDNFAAVTPSKILTTISSAMKSPKASNTNKEYALTALIKLSAKLPILDKKLGKLIGTFKTSMTLELQSRSIEFLALNEHVEIRNEVVARMPPIEKAKQKVSDLKSKDDEGESEEEEEEEESEDESEEESESEDDAPKTTWSVPNCRTPKKESKKKADKKKADKADKKASKAKSPKQAPAPAPEHDLLGLGDLMGTTSTPSTSQQLPASATASSSAGGELDILSGIFDSGGASVAASASVDFLDMFGVSSVSSSSPASPAPSHSNSVNAVPTPPGSQLFDNDGVQLYFKVDRKPDLPQSCLVTFNALNTTGDEVTDFALVVAVPKYMKKKAKPPSGTTVAAYRGGLVKHVIKLDNSADGKKTVMRVKVTYVKQGQKVEKVEECDVTDC